MHRQRIGLYLILFVLSVLVKWTIVYYYEVVSSDKLLQVAAANSIATGMGYSFPLVELSNPDSALLRPVVEWPPLYSILLVPFLKLTGSDIETSCFILDAIAGFLLLLFLFLLMQRLDLPLPAQALLLLHRAFEMNKDTLASYGSDSLATAMWLATFYFLLIYLERKKPFALAVLSITNAATFFLRYIYLPIAFVIPILLIWNGIRKKNRIEWKGGLITLLVVVAGIGLLALRNYIAAREGFFLLEAESGFFPENLLHWVPAFWLPFLNIDFFCMQVALITSVSYGRVYLLLQLTSVLLLLLLFYQYLRQLIRNNLITSPGYAAGFTYYAGGVSVCIFLLLLFLSLSTRMILPHLRESNWSYLIEVRYFQVPGLFIFLLVCSWAFGRHRQSLIRKFTRYALIASCSLQIAHGSWVLVKNYGVNRSLYSPYVASKENMARYLQEVSRQEATNGREIIVLTDKYGFIGESVINNTKVSSPVSQLNQDSFPLIRKKLLLLVIDQKSKEYYRPLIDKHQFLFDRDLGGNSIFKKYY